MRAPVPPAPSPLRSLSRSLPARWTLGPALALALASGAGCRLPPLPAPPTPGGDGGDEQPEPDAEPDFCPGCGDGGGDPDAGPGPGDRLPRCTVVDEGATAGPGVGHPDQTALLSPAGLFDTIDAPGSLTEVTWRLQRAPPGAHPLLEQAEAKALVTPDVPGVIELGVEATSPDGERHERRCALEVTPVEELRVVLTWDAADADLDLHVIRRDELGRFCVQSADGGALATASCGDGEVLDCYFGNCDGPSPSPPDWDGDGVVSDGDPRLLGDRLGDGGPEQTVVLDLAAGQYLIGVDFFSSSRPATRARVDVWWRGALLGSWQQVLEGGQWWEAVLVDRDPLDDDLCAADAESPDRCVREACPDDRCASCSDDEGCGPHSFCAPTTGTCQVEADGCASDEDCAGVLGDDDLPFGCVAVTASCVRPECLVDEDCADVRERCDGASRSCYLPPAVCGGDDDEPNDGLASARPLVGGTVEAILCRGNEDWWWIPTADDTGYAVLLEALAPGASGVRLTLVDEEGVAIDDDTAYPSALAFADRPGQNLALRVWTTSTQADAFPYRLTVHPLPAPPTCEEDGDPPATPPDLEPLVPVDSAHVEASLCSPSDRDDWLLTAPGPGLEARVTLLGAAFAGELQPRLSVPLFGGALDPVDGLVQTTPEPGVFTLRGGLDEPLLVLTVALPPPGSSGHPQGLSQAYAFDVEWIEPPCTVDDDEPNDVAADATPLRPGAMPSVPYSEVLTGSACDDDRDVFVFEGFAGETVTLTLEGPPPHIAWLGPAPDDLDTLPGAFPGAVATSSSAEGVPVAGTVAYTLEETGLVYLVVLSGQAQGGYTLTVEVAAP